MTTKTYTVEGMSCQHCVSAITAEVGKVPGVAGVTVDLAGKTVTVTGDAFEDAAIAAAVEEAGYTLVG
ncbi:Heavy metal transport/detoxification protein [Acidothermus cellulolyticus 11B]|uniref:Heavy metal transport/detoxification protein n=1 Tax=Acidothermus cellulolyticus (strain ATCC 43068 / DSM 8971 / 11B) TaxID=351607 RepID=A0LVG3_ACIC1|nr:cation transporter [Acidothermus cellulolyticus]ABK53423.1 Heavy metal transport/detoxification protein [Acidothermus cellulolyticus 11B]MBX5448123.1 heavy-metal-associated domain-containing protein [Acidothermus cellulolyticus]